jgi:predicted RNA binding protein YcfA (HicA-like mRNA interferase family)
MIRMKLPIMSGTELVKLLSSAGFRASGQRGSHLVLIKLTNERKLKTVVPLHRELAPGTLLDIIRQAGLSREEFLALYEGKR